MATKTNQQTLTTNENQLPFVHKKQQLNVNKFQL